MKKDIESEEDVKLFSDQFYEKLLQDNDLKHHFSHLDIEEHMEVVYSFWNTILLGTRTYKNNTIHAHSELKLKKEDFNTWLRLFQSTLNDLFEGPKTEEALSRANTIALTMRYKLLGE